VFENSAISNWQLAISQAKTGVTPGLNGVTPLDSGLNRVGRLTQADRVIGTSGDRVIGKAKTADDTDATARLGQAGRQRLTQADRVIGTSGDPRLRPTASPHGSAGAGGAGGTGRKSQNPTTDGR